MIVNPLLTEFMLRTEAQCDHRNAGCRVCSAARYSLGELLIVTTWLGALVTLSPALTAVAILSTASVIAAEIGASRFRRLGRTLRRVAARRASATGNNILRDLAEAIRARGEYRWVGIYRIADDVVTLVAWAGTCPPAHPRFPRDRGLTGVAIRERAVIVSNDVDDDPRYLTAFGDTRSEMIAPIMRAGQVVGTIDVESGHRDAFAERDIEFIRGVTTVAPVVL